MLSYLLLFILLRIVFGQCFLDDLRYTSTPQNSFPYLANNATECQVLCQQSSICFHFTFKSASCNHYDQSASSEAATDFTSGPKYCPTPEPSNVPTFRPTYERKVCRQGYDPKLNELSGVFDANSAVELFSVDTAAANTSDACAKVCCGVEFCGFVTMDPGCRLFDIQSKSAIQDSSATIYELATHHGNRCGCLFDHCAAEVTTRNGFVVHAEALKHGQSAQVVCSEDDWDGVVDITCKDGEFVPSKGGEWECDHEDHGMVLFRIFGWAYLVIIILMAGTATVAFIGWKAFEEFAGIENTSYHHTKEWRSIFQRPMIMAADTLADVIMLSEFNEHANTNWVLAGVGLLLFHASATAILTFRENMERRPIASFERDDSDTKEDIIKNLGLNVGREHVTFVPGARMVFVQFESKARMNQAIKQDEDYNLGEDLTHYLDITGALEEESCFSCQFKAWSLALAQFFSLRIFYELYLAVRNGFPHPELRTIKMWESIFGAIPQVLLQTYYFVSFRRESSLFVFVSLIIHIFSITWTVHYTDVYGLINMNLVHRTVLFILRFCDVTARIGIVAIFTTVCTPYYLAYLVILGTMFILIKLGLSEEKPPSRGFEFGALNLFCTDLHYKHFTSTIFNVVKILEAFVCALWITGKSESDIEEVSDGIWLIVGVCICVSVTLFPCALITQFDFDMYMMGRDQNSAYPGPLYELQEYKNVDGSKGFKPVKVAQYEFHSLRYRVVAKLLKRQCVPKRYHFLPGLILTQGYTLNKAVLAGFFEDMNEALQWVRQKLIVPKHVEDAKTIAGKPRLILSPQYLPVLKRLFEEGELKLDGQTQLARDVLIYAASIDKKYTFEYMENKEVFENCEFTGNMNLYLALYLSKGIADTPPLISWESLYMKGLVDLERIIFIRRYQEGHPLDVIYHHMGAKGKLSELVLYFLMHNAGVRWYSDEAKDCEGDYLYWMAKDPQCLRRLIRENTTPEIWEKKMGVITENKKNQRIEQFMSKGMAPTPCSKYQRKVYHSDSEDEDDIQPKWPNLSNADAKLPDVLERRLPENSSLSEGGNNDGYPFHKRDSALGFQNLSAKVSV